VYGCADAIRLDKLIKLNNKILRICQTKKLDCPLIDLYSTYCTLPIPALCEFQMLIFMFKYVHSTNSLPTIFRNSFPLNSSIHCYNTRAKDDFHLLPTMSSFGIKSAAHRGCKLWNELPETMKSIITLNS